MLTHLRVPPSHEHVSCQQPPCVGDHMKILGVWTPKEDESQETFVRRLKSTGKFRANRGWLGVAMYSVADLYDRIDALEAEVAELKNGRPGTD